VNQVTKEEVEKSSAGIEGWAAAQPNFAVPTGKPKPTKHTPTVTPKRKAEDGSPAPATPKVAKTVDPAAAVEKQAKELLSHWKAKEPMF